MRCGKLKREGICVQLLLIHAVVLQKPKERCKAISLQLKKKSIKLAAGPQKQLAPGSPLLRDQD